MVRGSHEARRVQKEVRVKAGPRTLSRGPRNRSWEETKERDLKVIMPFQDKPKKNRKGKRHVKERVKFEETKT
jgi:hypothetical protein